MDIDGLIIALHILLVHFIADFVFQTHEQSVKKSKSFKWLMYHTLTYSVITFMGWSMYIMHSKGFRLGFYLFLITLITHTLTDYFTSRWTSRLWKEEKVHDFFVVIGFDQMLHYIQLFATYWFLTEIL